MTHFRSRAAGFTLLEILLALVLLAFVMLGVWGALAGATRITHSADRLMAKSGRVHVVQQFLRGCLATAARQPWTQLADHRRMFKGDATSMQYVATLPMQAGRAGLYLQTLSLEKNASGKLSLWLEYQPYTGIQPAADAPVRHVLLQKLASGKFQYLGASAPGEPAKWLDAWTAVNRLPQAVRISLQPAWQTSVVFPSMLIPLHSQAGLGVRVGGGQ